MAQSLQRGRQVCRTAFRSCLFGIFGTSSVKTTRSGDAQRSTSSTPKNVVFYYPSRGVYRGRDEIDRIASAIKATHPDFSYWLIAEPEKVGGGQVPWVSSRPGDAPAYAGMDFIIARTAGLPPFISSSTSCPEPGARCIDARGGTGLAPGSDGFEAVGWPAVHISVV
jgi:hypothetical protein